MSGPDQKRPGRLSVFGYGGERAGRGPMLVGLLLIVPIIAAFGLWYATDDVSAYERETDLFALERGCGEGLIAFRTWLYAQLDDEAIAEKQRDYYTPEEIEAWMAGG